MNEVLEEMKERRNGGGVLLFAGSNFTFRVRPYFVHARISPLNRGRVRAGGYALDLIVAANHVSQNQCLRLFTLVQI